MNEPKRKKQILIVDDEQITLRALREEFTAAGRPGTPEPAAF